MSCMIESQKAYILVLQPRQLWDPCKNLYYTLHQLGLVDTSYLPPKLQAVLFMAAYTLVILGQPCPFPGS